MVGVRRANAQSDDSGYASLPKEVSIEEWVAQKDKFRVVAHGLPLALPRLVTTSGVQLEDILKGLKPSIIEILTTHHISFQVPIIVQYCYHKHDKSNGQNIVMIGSNDIDTRFWLTAATSILSLFQANANDGADQIVKDLQVEIFNPAKVYADRSVALPDDPVMVEALLGVRSSVSETVRTLFQSAWSSIAYHLRVNFKSKSREGGKPTVIVFFPPGTSSDFETAEDRIIQILENAPIEIHLEFLPGKSLLLADNQGTIYREEKTNPHLLRDLTEKPQNGSSIGIEDDQHKAGSLGGWLFLNLPSERRQMRCALTCYHVIRSNDEDVAAHTDAQGILSNDARGQEMVQYPAPIDAATTKDYLINMEEKQARDIQQYRILSSILSGPGGPEIGKVAFASGHRVKEGHRLDWALIESPSTFTHNKPPDYSSFTVFKPPYGVSYTPNTDSKVRNFAQVKYDEWVTKRGRTTGVTSGNINSIGREVQWSSTEITEEIEILSCDGNFAEPGDSGSLVLNRRGELVGMIFAVGTYAGNFDAAYMIPIDRVQQDIKDMTGGGFLSLD